MIISYHRFMVGSKVMKRFTIHNTMSIVNNMSHIFSLSLNSTVLEPSFISIVDDEEKYGIMLCIIMLYLPNGNPFIVADLPLTIPI